MLASVFKPTKICEKPFVTPGTRCIDSCRHLQAGWCPPWPLPQPKSGSLAGGLRPLEQEGFEHAGSLRRGTPVLQLVVCCPVGPPQLFSARALLSCRARREGERAGEKAPQKLILPAVFPEPLPQLLVHMAKSAGHRAAFSKPVEEPCSPQLGRQGHLPLLISTSSPSSTRLMQFELSPSWGPAVSEGSGGLPYSLGVC
jgi:hypothetical protein